MPLTLTVRKSAQLPSSGSPGTPGSEPALTFDGTRIVIGRGQGCDVRLPDPSVSQRHATIRVEDGKHSLVDEGSTNGSFVGGVKLSPQTPRVLRSGDLVRVGRVWLEVRIDQTPATRDLAVATRELALMLVAQAMDEQGDDTVPKVRVVEGPDTGAVLSLFEEGRAYYIGRDDESDLPLADADASRQHLQLVRRGAAVLVRDPGSKNGALIGESRLSRDRDVAWRGTSMLRVGRTVLSLEEPVAQALGALEGAADEPILEADVPPEPPPSRVSGASLAPAPQEAAAPPSKSSPPSSKAPASAGGGAAPIAQVATATSPPAPARARGGWSATDFAVVFAAIAIIALSVAGLFWLLKT